MTTTTSRAPLPAPARRRRPFNPRRAGAWALLVLAIAVSVLPFLWMLRTALSTNGSLASQSSQPAARRLHLRRLPAGVRAAEPGGRHRRRRFGGRDRLLALPAELHHLLLHHHRGGRVLQRAGCLRLRPAALEGPELCLQPVPGHHAGPADLHGPAQLPADQEPGPAQHDARHGAALRLYDAVRHLLPAPVLPEHVPRGRRSRHARRRQAPAHLLPDRPPQRRRAHRHPGPADLHRPVERILLAAARRIPGGRPRPARGPRRLQIPVPAGRPGLVRPHGRNPGRRHCPSSSSSPPSARRSSTPSASPASNKPRPTPSRSSPFPNGK